jgi:4,5-dihydroxyphthalate decarboxylase
MSTLRLTFAGGDYDRTRALADGTIRPEGIDLVYLPLSPEEIFQRMARYQEFDVAEAGLTNQVVYVAQGDCPVVAIPAFLSRCFRHGCVFVNAAAGIERPEDLRGKRVGVPAYSMAAAVWIRGMLEHEYGVRAADMEWFEGGLQAPGRQRVAHPSLPPEIRLQPLGPEQTLDAMLVAGEIDALYTARLPPSFLQGDPHVRRLFPDYKATEREYFRKTGLFPIMHCVVVRRRIYEEYPWVTANLLKALDAAKQRAQEQAYDYAALPYTLPWLIADIEEARRELGPDPWPYGVAPNRVVLEAMRQYVHEQGMTARQVAVDELFAPNTYESYRV